MDIHYKLNMRGCERGYKNIISKFKYTNSSFSYKVLQNIKLELKSKLALYGF